MGGAAAPSFFSVRGTAPPPAIRWPLLLPYLRAVRAARPGRMARPAVPARGYRPSACPLRRPYGRPRDQKECGRHCNRPTGPRRLPAGLRPPVAWWSRGLVVCGRARRGPPWSASAGCAARPKTGGDSPPPKWSASRGRACGALRAARHAG